MKKAIRIPLLLVLALIVVVKLNTPLAHAQDEDSYVSPDQQSYSDVPPPAPTPIDEDPAVQAEPIDDEQDF